MEQINSKASMVSEATSEGGREPISATHRLHKLLHKRLRIPQGMIQPFLSAARIAGNPTQYWVRKRLAKEIIAGAEQGFHISHKNGYHFFRQMKFQGLRILLDTATHCIKNPERLF